MSLRTRPPYVAYEQDRGVLYAERLAAIFAVTFTSVAVVSLLLALMEPEGRADRIGFAVGALSAAIPLKLIWWLLHRSRTHTW